MNTRLPRPPHGAAPGPARARNRQRASTTVSRVPHRGTTPPGAGRRAFLPALIGLTALQVAACSRYIDPNVPEPIRPRVEPAHGAPYLLYRPSQYDRRYAWPLIVDCHTSFPDSPNRRIRKWTELAESRGFLVAVPKLTGTRRALTPKAPKQLRRIRADEERILAAIRHIRAGHNVSEDRIFIHGFSGGAYAALYTGLRHPDLFRAISLSQPKFKEGCVAPVAGSIDPHQPVLVDFSLSDAITGKHAQRCVDWLRTQAVDLTEQHSSRVPGADMHPSVAFFENVVRRVPWIHIRALPGPSADPMTMRFKLRCSFQPARYQWDFGDGATSEEAEPTHAYARPDTYRVRVALDDARGDRHRRFADLALPEGLLTAVYTASLPSPKP